VTYDQTINLVRRLFNSVPNYTPCSVFIWHWNYLMGVEEHSKYFSNFKVYSLIRCDIDQQWFIFLFRHFPRDKFWHNSRSNSIILLLIHWIMNNGRYNRILLRQSQLYRFDSETQASSCAKFDVIRQLCDSV
jgi:hypothetical protein